MGTDGAGQAARIKALRRSLTHPKTGRRLTQAALGDAIDMSYRSVQNWERHGLGQSQAAKKLSDYFISRGLRFATREFIEDGPPNVPAPAEEDSNQKAGKPEDSSQKAEKPEDSSQPAEAPEDRLAALKDAVSGYGNQLDRIETLVKQAVDRIETLLKRALAPPAQAAEAQPAAGPPTPEGELGRLLSDDQPSQQARRRKRRRRAEGGQPGAGE